MLSVTLTTMPFRYQAGEAIRVGDRVLLHGKPGRVEVIADPAVDPTDWFVTEHGGGVLIAEPRLFGRVFVGEPQNEEGLVLVARDPNGSAP
jgi:hypothetical protein